MTARASGSTHTVKEPTDGTGLAIGAALVLVGAAALGRRGSRAPFAGETLPQALLAVLDAHPPEVGVRTVMLMEGLPDALRESRAYTPKRKLRKTLYMKARGMDQLRFDVATERDRSRRTAPDLVGLTKASFSEVAAYLRRELEAGTWYRGDGWWVEQNPQMPVHWGPYARWVADEIARVMRDLPPIRVRGSRLARGYRRLVELDVDKIERLVGYHLDANQIEVDPRTSWRAIHRDEHNRWKRFKMDEVFPRGDPREVDRNAPTGLVVLGGRQIPDMNRYRLTAPQGVPEEMFGLIFPTPRVPIVAPPPPASEALVTLHIDALFWALPTIREATWIHESGRGWPVISSRLEAGEPYPEVLKVAKRVIKDERRLYAEHQAGSAARRHSAGHGARRDL
jgi:hypothetical protein